MTPRRIIAISLYGLTILPSCILAIWFRRKAAVWLVALFPITFFGVVYQIATGPRMIGQDFKALVQEILVLLVFCAIPGVLGTLLLRNGKDDRQAEADH
jgi:hypothetical protein